VKQEGVNPSYYIFESQQRERLAREVALDAALKLRSQQGVGAPGTDVASLVADAEAIRAWLSEGTTTS